MKTVLVTGGSRGIGAATAKVFASAGYAVAINYFRNKELAEKLAEELTGKGHTALPFYADIANKEQVVQMAEEIQQSLGRIDVLVNNAGISAQCLVTDVSEKLWNEMVGVNLSGTLFCTQAVLPGMIQNKSGAIVNVSSMWGTCGASCEVAYSTLKAGVIGMTKALAKEVGPSSIRVNCVAPGLIDTDMNKNLPMQDKQALYQDTPLGRIGTPTEVADVIFYLASERASFVTGQILGVDGGFAI